VRHHAHEPSSEEAFARFPAWMWRNVDVSDLPAHVRHPRAAARRAWR
jgi:erythromycin esterase-like protein